jgi:uncharacterized membrane protein
MRPVMESKVKIAGHPVHPMLIVFPLGLVSTAVIFDILYLFSNRAQWTEVAYYMIGAGVVGGLGAALFGFLDWLAIPRRTPAKRIGRYHGLGNVLVITLFVLSWILRREHPGFPPTDAVVAGIGGLIVGVITVWLGGELVSRLGVGVDKGANQNEPSSLSALPAESVFGAPAPAGMSLGYTGSDRRRFDKPAWAGAERRSGAGR